MLYPSTMSFHATFIHPSSLTVTFHATSNSSNDENHYEKGRKTSGARRERYGDQSNDDQKYNDDNDDDHRFDLEDLNSDYDFDDIIPNNLLDQIDPDGVVDRIPELLSDVRFW